LEISNALRQADQLRADPQLKRIFEKLFTTFKIDHKDELDKVIYLSKKALARTLSDPTHGPIPAVKAIKGGAPLTSNDPDYYPLYMAVQNGDLETVKAMLAPRRLDLGNEPMYSTPMVLAATRPFRFEDLTEHADVNEETKPPVALIPVDHILLFAGESKKPRVPITVLTLAVMRGDSAIVEHLLTIEEVNVNAQRGLALYLAMHYFNQHQVAEPHRAKVLKLLLQHKNIDVELSHWNKRGYNRFYNYESPLHFAIFLGNKGLIYELLNCKSPVDVNKIHKSLGTALDIAERYVGHPHLLSSIAGSRLGDVQDRKDIIEIIKDARGMRSIEVDMKRRQALRRRIVPPR
jgi:hypothetical protein